MPVPGEYKTVQARILASGKTCRANSLSFIDPGSVERPENSLQWVNQPAATAELNKVRRSVNHGTPLWFIGVGFSYSSGTRFGSESKTKRTVEKRIGNLDYSFTPAKKHRTRNLRDHFQQPCSSHQIREKGFFSHAKHH